jgi:serine/arginine repetitive matrix protein 2
VPATPDTSANQSKTQTTIKKPTVAGLPRHQSLGSLPIGESPGTSKPNKLPQRSGLSNLPVPSTPPRPSSVVSEADCELLISPQVFLLTLPQDRSFVKEAGKEKLKEREREWNKPSATPNRSPAHVHERVRKLSTPVSGVVRDSPHSLTARNLELHHRRSSSRNSLIPHSPASSIVSFDQERDRESEHVRERNWNSPHPKWDGSRGSPSPTPSNISERRRTLSHPTRPTLGSRPRYDSTTHSSSSRAASPALSHSSKASVEEEVEHERERNWNSSRPTWSKRNSIGSSSGSPSSSLHQESSKQTPIRQRTQSLKNIPSPPSDPLKVSRPRLGRSSLSHITPIPAKSPPKSPPKESQLSPSQPDIVISPSTPPRPSVFPKPKPPFSPPKQPDLSSRWKFPATTVSDTESEPESQDKDGSTQPPASPERPPPDSRIPVRVHNSAVKLDDIPKPKEASTTHHRRSFTEFHQANGAIPPRFNLQTVLPPRNLAPEDALHSMWPLDTINSKSLMAHLHRERRGVIHGFSHE